MKKILAIILSTIMVLALVGCGQNFKFPGVEKTNGIEVLKVEKSSNSESIYEGYKTLFSSEYDVILLEEGYEKKYPALKNALAALSADTVSTVDANMQEIGDFAREMYAYDRESFYERFTSNIYKDVKRSDSVVFSIEESYDQYQGGVHPNYWYGGVNFDTKTGKKLTLGEVFNDVTGLGEIIRNELKEKYDEETFFDIDGETFDKITPENDSDWVIEYDKIVFYFSPYEIAPFAAGLVTAELFFSEYGDIINDRFEMVPDGYVVNLTNAWNGTRVDLDKNTEGVDEISLTYSYEDYMYKDIEISVNSNIYTYEKWFYDMESYLVHMEEKGVEKNYLYIVSYGENDYAVLAVFSLTSYGVMLEETFGGMAFEARYYDDSYVKNLFTDIKNFRLGTRMHFLGTYSPTKEYSVDYETGVPVSKQDWYDVDSKYPHVTKVDLDVIMLKDNSERKIPAGEEMMFIRTDGESYGDFVLESGEECRINVENGEWYYTINSMSEYDVFEELLYAD